MSIRPRRRAGPALAICAALALPLAALGGAQGNPPDAQAFVEKNVGLTSKPLGIEQLRARIGATSGKAREVPNAHVPGQVDQVIVLSGPGVEVEAYAPAGGGPVLVRRITVTGIGKKLRLPAGLVVGKSRIDDVYAAIGEDAETTTGPGGAFARRFFTMERNASALLWFDRKERLAGVEWRFEGD